MDKGCVLDASVTTRWILQDGSKPDRDYADQVVETFNSASAWVPGLWYTEVIHVLRCAEDNASLGEVALTGFIYHLEKLPIQLDSVSPVGIKLAVAAIAREFKLPGYDAQYLELARRTSSPIATLDKELRKAAKKSGSACLSDLALPFAIQNT